MAIDTEVKRASVFEVPGLQTNPPPSGTIGQSQRTMISDLYAFFPVSAPSFLPSQTCWVPSKQNTSTWIRASSNTSIWVNSKQNTSTWVPEKEVVPCQD